MMRLKNSRLVLLVVAAIAALNGAYVAASECDDVGYLATEPKIPDNSTVDVIIDKNSLVGVDATAIVTQAANTLSGRVGGINFNVTSEEGDRPSIIVNFVNEASPVLPDGSSEAASWKGYPKSDGTLSTGVVTVYLGARGCGSSSTSLCYDPSQQAAYQNAVLRMVTHELIHSLGGTNSNMANVMAPFVGVNSSGNQAWGVDCIVNKLPGLRNQASSPPLACY